MAKLFSQFNRKAGLRILQQETLECLAILAAAPASTPVVSGTADVVGVAGVTGLRLFGYTARESAGSAAAAAFNVRNGATVAGPIVAVEEIAADGCVHRSFPGGIPCDDGVFLDRVTGSSEVVFYTKVVA